MEKEEGEDEDLKILLLGWRLGRAFLLRENNPFGHGKISR